MYTYIHVEFSCLLVNLKKKIMFSETDVALKAIRGAFMKKNIISLEFKSKIS